MSYKIRSGIYCIRNIINNKVYIGSAINLYSRRDNHFYLLKKNKHFNIHLQRTYNKYGKDAFIFDILYIVDDVKDLIHIEDLYIKLFQSTNQKYGYNIRKNARSNLGLKHSEETKKKMSLNSSKPNLGKHLSEETKQKLREINIGNKHSKETKRKMSEKGKGRKKKDGFAKGEQNGRAKLTEEIVKEIKLKLLTTTNFTELAKEFGIGRTQINRIRSGEHWGWVAIENEEEIRNTIKKAKKKLTEKEVIEIKIKLLNNISILEIVDEYNIKSRQVYRIKSGKVWKEVKLPQEFIEELAV